MMKLLLGGILLLTAITSNAATWITSSGTVNKITTYAHTETILVTISTSGTNVGECSNKGTFAISKDMTAEGRARMYAMLLAAQASGRSVNLAYLNVGGCESWFSSPNVYRKIAIIS